MNTAIKKLIELGAKSKELALLQRKAQRIVEIDCMGLYENESIHERKVAELSNTCAELLGVEKLPDFIQLQGDPRGAVTKVIASKITPDEHEALVKARFSRDMGGDFMLGVTAWQ